MIRFVYVKGSADLDGIRAYAEHCVEALQTHAQLPATLEFWGADDRPRVSARDLIVIQYNPFSYGKRGVAPWLVRRLASIRRSAKTARIILVVHEAYVPPRSVRWALMSAWQRGQLAALGRLAHALVVSTESWRLGVRRLVGDRPITAIPVGSNLPDRRGARHEIRSAHGWGEETLVIAALGADKAARLPNLVRAALDQTACRGADVVFANLGLAPVDTDFGGGVRHFHPGLLDPESLAREMSAADLFLAPYEDGVSLRRTTFAAALQHGLAIIGTHGRNTEVELLSIDAIRLAPVDDPAAFGAAAREIAHDRGQRTELGHRAREFYERRLAWPVIAAQYGDLLDTVRNA